MPKDETETPEEPQAENTKAEKRAAYLTEIEYQPPSPTWLAEIKKKHPGLLVLYFDKFCKGLVLAAVPPSGEVFDSIFSAQVLTDLDGEERLLPISGKAQARRIGVAATQWPVDEQVRENIFRLWPLIPMWIGQMMLAATGFIAVPTTGEAAGT